MKIYENIDCLDENFFCYDEDLVLYIQRSYILPTAHTMSKTSLGAS